jgi:hypothetical protein
MKTILEVSRVLCTRTIMVVLEILLLDLGRQDVLVMVMMHVVVVVVDHVACCLLCRVVLCVLLDHGSVGVDVLLNAASYVVVIWHGHVLSCRVHSPN